MNPDNVAGASGSTESNREEWRNATDWQQINDGTWYRYLSPKRCQYRFDNDVWEVTIEDPPSKWSQLVALVKRLWRRS